MQEMLHGGEKLTELQWRVSHGLHGTSTTLFTGTVTTLSTTLSTGTSRVTTWGSATLALETLQQQ